MRAITTAARAVLGGYLAAHGAQKLFGSFGGAGLDGTAEMFERLGLTPGRQMATLAGVSELTGGLLTATGVADPLGPIAVASTMAVATAVHRKGGPFATKGGYELPLTNLAFARRPRHRPARSPCRADARPADDRGGGRGRSGPGRDGAVEAARPPHPRRRRPAAQNSGVRRFMGCRPSTARSRTAMGSGAQPRDRLSDEPEGARISRRARG